MTISYALYRGEMATPSGEGDRHNRTTVARDCSGYWRISASKMKTDWPVFIWADPDSNAVSVRVGGNEFNATAEPDKWQSFTEKSWMHCSAVSKADYQVAIDTGFWPDGRPARNMTQEEKLGVDVQGGGANDAPIDELLADQISALAAKLAAVAKPTSQAEADAVQTMIDRMTLLLKKAESTRVTEKQPHMNAAAAVDAHWKGIMNPGTEAKDKALFLQKAFLKEELARRQEQARKEAEEAAERAAAEQTERNKALAEQAEQMGIPTDGLEDEVEVVPVAPAPVELPKASSSVGRAAGLKKVKRGIITDLPKLVAFFFPADGDPDPEALAYLQTRVDKATRGKITLPGVTVQEEFN